MMRTRKNFIPKTWQDLAITLFVILIIPIIYWFELFVVLPKFYELWSSWYNFHFTLGTFILFNVTANFVSVILCDTSINGIILQPKMMKNWRLCSVCECLAPPRSWHCNNCKTCILKRDHHCHFTGCCIGHNNMRYFLMFIFYVFIATVYATYYNVHFMYEIVDLVTWKSVLKLIFPLAMIFVEWTMNQMCLFLALIVVLACCFSGVLIYFHLGMIVNGLVTYERKFKNRPYDLGREENLRSVLGERWHLIWISPFVESNLTHDGINWVARDTEKSK